MKSFVAILKSLVIVSFVVIAIHLSYTAFFIFMLAGAGGGCGNDIHSAVTSPDGALIATVSWQDCGAASRFITMVSLRRNGSSFDIGGYDDRNVVLGLRDGYDLTLKWTANDKLKVSDITPGEIPPDDVAKKEPLWNSVSITYDFRARSKLKPRVG